MRETDAAVSYIAEALRMITENTANLSGGRYITAALRDALGDRYGYASSACTQTGDEIIERIRSRLRE